MSGVSQELCMRALSSGGPGEHGVGWSLESEPQPGSSGLLGIGGTRLPACVFRLEP